MPDLLSDLSKTKNLELEKGASLSKKTSWRVGGPAEYLVTVMDLDALRSVVLKAVENDIPLLILGRGTNVLVSDNGFRGIVICMSGDFSRIDVFEESIRAGAAAPLAAIADAAAKASLAGLEFAEGIPGTAGGAVMTNAGAYSSSTRAVLKRIRTLDLKGEYREYDQFEDAYRATLVPDGSIVTEAQFKLKKASREEIEGMTIELRKRRRATQPWGVATAGSVFKNPKGESAWRLVEACGLKGKIIGGAKISELHANFIINTGGASAADIKALIDYVTEEVQEQFGVGLRTEVRLVGFEKE